MVSEPGGELIVYRGADGRSEVQLRAVGGTVWLAQAQIAELYGTAVQIIRRDLDGGEVTEATANSELVVHAASRVNGTSALFDLGPRTLVFRSPAVGRSRRTSAWVEKDGGRRRREATAQVAGTGTPATEAPEEGGG